MQVTVMTAILPELEGLPAARSIAKGIEDLAAGRSSNEAYLVAMAPSRLRSLGLVVPPDEQLPEEPELALYGDLCNHCSAPHSRYNALRHELDSFMNALAARRHRQRLRATETS